MHSVVVWLEPKLYRFYYYNTSSYLVTDGIEPVLRAPQELQ